MLEVLFMKLRGILIYLKVTSCVSSNILGYRSLTADTTNVLLLPDFCRINPDIRMLIHPQVMVFKVIDYDVSTCTW